MSSTHRLLELYERQRSAAAPMVLATVIRTGGSTYAKPGAQMLIAADGEYAGLLSGGCLEGDLRERAREVSATGAAAIVGYDLRSTSDQLFGLGAGCEGAMDILLTRHGPDDGWQPLPLIGASQRRGFSLRLAFVVASRDAGIPLGTTLAVDGELPASARADPRLPAVHASAATAPPNSIVPVAGFDAEVFALHLPPPPRLLLLGGGPDARPVAELGAFLGWRVTVADHRSAYLDPARFAAGTELVESRAADIAQHVPLAQFAAAVVMSHHLDSDLEYLRALAGARIPYVGLLGPAARREKLLSDLGADAQALRARLRAPVGLDIGGRAPESIALSIVGEIHAALMGREGRPFTQTA